VLGVPAAWDLEGATGGMGSRSHEKTEFAGISTVPPGCYAIARDGDVRIYPYWDWEIPTAEQMRGDTRSDAEIVDEFREVLVDSVRQRLVADVEVASYLSGGIDSCAVLGLAQQEMDRPIRAFTLTFENPLYDDAPNASNASPRSAPWSRAAASPANSTRPSAPPAPCSSPRSPTPAAPTHPPWARWPRRRVTRGWSAARRRRMLRYTRPSPTRWPSGHVAVEICRRGVLKCQRRHDEASNTTAATIQNSGRHAYASACTPPREPGNPSPADDTLAPISAAVIVELAVSTCPANARRISGSTSTATAVSMCCFSIVPCPNHRF
ncbi:MAG: hypothetical protein QOD10_1469, partial [Mycobacterium sp.]|nr:hypothetical protein [Mycobacterium sp.]